jgi:hypothetical protein
MGKSKSTQSKEKRVIATAEKLRSEEAALPKKARKVLMNPQPMLAPKPARRAPRAAAVGSTIGTALGSLLPAPFNSLVSPILGKIGDFVGEKAGTFLGTGDYEVNSLIDGLQGKGHLAGGNNSVSYVHSQNDEVVFTRREYIGDVISAPVLGEFQITRYRVQPTDGASFPYLSGIAKLHQQWCPRGIVYQFKSNTGLISSAATPNVGVVIMAMEYDASKAAPFSNKLQMESSYGGISTPTTEPVASGIECKADKKVLANLLCRNDPANDAQKDPQIFDLGTFCIATVGQPAASQNCGELWVSYDIVLSKPLLDRVTTGDPRCSQWRMDLTAAGDAVAGRSFLSADESVLDPDYCLTGETNNLKSLKVEAPPWLNPSTYTAGNMLYFPDMSPGVYQVLILQGLVTTGTTFNLTPNATSSRCTVGPIAVVDGEVSSLLTGGQTSGALAFSTPQSGANYGNLQSCVFAMDVHDQGPTILMNSIGTRACTWCWIQVTSIPREQTSFGVAAAYRRRGAPLPLPPDITPSHCVRMRRDCFGQPEGFDTTLSKVKSASTTKAQTSYPSGAVSLSPSGQPDSQGCPQSGMVTVGEDGNFHLVRHDQASCTKCLSRTGSYALPPHLQT